MVHRGIFFQAEDGIRDGHVTGVQTCALPISNESIHEWLEEKNLYWADDFHIANSMVVSTLKSFVANSKVNFNRSEERRVGKEGKAWRKEGSVRKKAGNEERVEASTTDMR